ncbi:hypothetical protein C5S39_02145 [Candidatus Methanophagaceae archaeon]|nr:hypothetical protein C5S39_02145 [Methanophagales archaeon]
MALTTILVYYLEWLSAKFINSGIFTMKYMLPLYLNLTAIVLFPSHDTGKFLPDSYKLPQQ